MLLTFLCMKLVTVSFLFMLSNSNMHSKCWTLNPRVVGSIPGDADCFIWDNVLGQDVNTETVPLSTQV